MSTSLRSRAHSKKPRYGVLFVAAAVLCLATAGGLLWWRQGEAIFSTYLTAALAWCF